MDLPSPKKALVIGVGTLGCKSAEMLATLGINLHIVDRDIIEPSNLASQTLYLADDLGHPKAEVAAQKLQLNGKITVEHSVADADREFFQNVSADIIVDCTDNLETRFLINDFSLKNKIPWVHAAAAGTKGNVIGFDLSRACFRCIFDVSAVGETCEASGIAPPAASMAASLQVAQVVKILGKLHSQEFLRFDVLKNSLDSFVPKKSLSCIACNGKYEYLEGEKGSKAVKMCGSDTYQVKGKKVEIELLKKQDGAVDLGGCVRVSGIFVFKDGRALVRAGSVSEARSKYSRLLG